MPEDWLRTGIGLLVAGNAFFIVGVIRKANRSHDELIAIKATLKSLLHSVREMKDGLGHLSDLKADVALLKFKVFGQPRNNGHDKVEEADDLDL